MKGNDTQTFDPAMLGDQYARDFRAQATGIGQTLSASRATGAMRAQRVIDCAPRDQQRVADRSYPKPSPVMRNGQLCDAVTYQPVHLALAMTSLRDAQS